MTETSTKVKKILVVEDEKSLSNILKKALEHSGFEVSVVTDGESALDCLSKNKFDLILLDILLPKMNGFDVLAEMSKRRDLTPVIALTNLSREEARQEAIGLGAKNYLVKSETPIAEIVKMVQNFN